MRVNEGVEKVHHVEENGNFTLQKNNIYSVTGNLPLKNCVMHIICHFSEGKFLCNILHFQIVFWEGYYSKTTIKFWKVMEF